MLVTRFPLRLLRDSLLVLVPGLFAAAIQAQPAEAIPVSIQPLDEVLVDLQRSASAEVVSLNQATLAAEVAGVIRAVHADVGHSVQAGELLLEIDPTDYRLALQQAEAGLATSRAQKAQADVRLQRARQLIEGKYLSDDDLLARETEAQVAAAQIRQQEAAVAIARRNLEKCRIEAPFNGVVGQRMAQVGSYVGPGTALMVFAETDRIELDAEIPDELADTLEFAQSIEFRSRNESWPLQLLRLSPVIDTERRSRRARFDFTGAAPHVGRSGEVVWQVSRGLLPASLVLQRDGRLGVFVAESGVARFTVLSNAQEGRPVPVDLPASTQVVVTGRERLQDGDAIKPL